MLQDLDVRVVETGRVHRVVGAASVVQAIFAVATVHRWATLGYADDHDALTVMDLCGDARVVNLTSVILYSMSKGLIGVSKYRLLDAVRAACVNGRRLGS